MSYAFTMSDMRTYLSYLQTKKQNLLFAEAEDENTDEEENTGINEKNDETKRPEQTDTEDDVEDAGDQPM